MTVRTLSLTICRSRPLCASTLQSVAKYVTSVLRTFGLVRDKDGPDGIGFGEGTGAGDGSGDSSGAGSAGSNREQVAKPHPT